MIRADCLSGWRLTGVILAGVATLVAMAVLLTPESVLGVRLAIRLTARTSLILFLLAFVATPLERLAPSRLTTWLKVNRRFIGLAFAGSHGLHLGAIIAFAQLDPIQFGQRTTIGAYVGGGVAYVFIILMTATSFDRMAAWLGRTAWSRVHTAGLWFIWLSFVLNNAKRIPVSGLYLLPVLALIAAMLLRLLASRRTAHGHALSGEA